MANLLSGLRRMDSRAGICQMRRMMHMETLARFGPWAVAAGAFVEGETTLLLAGGAIALGMLDFWPVVVAAFVGSLAGDQVFFWLGRCKGKKFLQAHSRFADRVCKVWGLLLRHRLLLLAGYRFVYGLRALVPFAFGLSPLCWKYFLASNVVTAALWSVLVTRLGLHAGRLLDQGQPALVAGILALAVIVFVVVRRWLKGRF